MRLDRDGTLDRSFNGDGIAETPIDLIQNGADRAWSGLSAPTARSSSQERCRFRGGPALGIRALPVERLARRELLGRRDPDAVAERLAVGRRRPDERQHRRRGWRERALDGRSPSPRGRSRPVLRCGWHRPDVDRSSVGNGLGGRRPAARGRQDRRRRTSRRRLWPREVPGDRGARRELRRERRRHDLDLDRRRDHGSHGAARREGGRGRLQPGLRPGLLLVQARPLPDEWSAGSDLRQRRARGDGFPDTWEAHPSSISVQPDGKLVVAGNADPDYWYHSVFALARYRTDGSLDTSFGDGGTRQYDFGCDGSSGYGAVLQPVGSRLRIVQAGGASCYGEYHMGAIGVETDGPPFPRGAYRVETRSGQSIIPGTTQIDNRCSDCTTEITLPWTVWVYGIPYRTAHASSNGTLQFSSASASGRNGCLPFAALGTTVVPFWDDLSTRDTGGIWTGISGPWVAAVRRRVAGLHSAVTGTRPSRSSSRKDRRRSPSSTARARATIPMERRSSRASSAAVRSVSASPAGSRVS